jgi:5'-nucleotidase (lipoprotein e(P4) family)
MTHHRKPHHLSQVFIAVILFLSISTACQTTQKTADSNSQSEEQTFHPDLKAVYWYQNAAEVRALYYQAYNIAEMRLDYYINNISPVKPLAVILDVDETVLDNSPYQGAAVREGISYPTGWTEWVNQEKAKLLPGVRDFLNHAAEQKVEVFYVTNRNEKEKEATVANLKQFGLPNADAGHVFVKSKTSDKTARRRTIIRDYEIVLLIGDNLGDFDHLFQEHDTERRNELVDEYRSMFGDRFIMLPNSMYGDWEGAAFDYDYSQSLPERYQQLEEGLNVMDTSGIEE